MEPLTMFTRTLITHKTTTQSHKIYTDNPNQPDTEGS